MENRKNNKGFSQDQDDKSRKPKRMPKKKVCQFCQDKIGEVDYKDITRLRRFITEKGKMVPRRASGACAYHQRELGVAIKRARQMALLPYKAE